MNNFNNEDFFKDFLSDLTAANLQASGEMSIIEFANRIIFNNDPSFQLYPTQKAILKSFYKEPLTNNEIDILNTWVQEERSTWVKDRKYISLVLEAGRRASKCWKLDDVLTVTDKGLYYIEEIAKENAIDTNNTGWNPLKNKMSAIQEIGKEQEITDIYVENKVKTKRITTREGYAFEATPEHKIKVLEPSGNINWKEFQYINSNDYVVINKNNDYLVKDYFKIPLDIIKNSKRYDYIRPFVKPNLLNETMGYFLGVLCGDGTWKSSSCHIASDINDEPFLKNIFQSFFGQESYEVKKEKVSGNCKLIKIGNSNLKKIVKYLGYELKEDGQKQVPWAIRRSPKSVIAAFLSGLFDTDGTVVKDGRTIEFCAKDYNLTREIQQLLLLFGIICNIKQYYNNKFKTFHWKLRINGKEGREIFCKEIGFKLPRKQQKIEQDLLVKIESKEGGYLLSIPYQQDKLYNYKQSLDIPTDNFIRTDKNLEKGIKNKLRGCVKSERAFRSEFRNIAGNCCKKNNKENITYPKLKKLLDWTKSKNILNDMLLDYKYISENNFFFSKVETIEEKEGDVGDINVSNTHKYLANGCVSHNCNSESADIITTEGTISVGELHKRLSNKEKIGIYTYDIESNITKSLVTYNIKTELNQIEQTYKLTTETNKTEITNNNHPFLCIDKKSLLPKWVELKDLKQGDYIATSSEIPIFGNKEKSKDQLILMALALSNISTGKYCQEVFNKYHLILNKYFNTNKLNELLIHLQNYRDSLKKQDITLLSKNSTLILLNNILKIIKSSKIRKRRRSQRKLEVAKKNAHIKNFICTNKDLPESCEVTLELHKFRREIAGQFLKLGISSYYLQEPVYNLYAISICNTDSINKLIEIFGWDIYKGKEYLKRTFNYRNLTPWGYKRTLLNTRDDVLENQYPATELSDSRTRREGSLRVKGTKKELAAEALRLNNSKLYDLATNNINWEKIISIEPYKVEQTIALEVENTHVIGNPIISHNSTMASIIALKEFYDLIILDNPQQKYNILTKAPIAILVMAQSQAQVKETIFAAMKGYAENSRYFMSLQNKGEIEILSEEIRCKSKNISIFAKHTNSKSLVGYTVKAMILDEVARFETLGEDGRNKAFEIWDNVGCHKEDNLIYTNQGMYKAKDFLHKNLELLTYDLNTGEQYYTKDYKVFDNGIKQVSRIETSLGRNCEVTQEHPFLVWDSNELNPIWKQRKDLQIGDCIAININNDIQFKSEPTYNIFLSKILGYLISDGNITSSTTSIRQRFINKDINIIKDFNNCLKQWNSNYYLQIDNKSYCDYKYKISRYEKNTKNNLLISWLKEIKIAGHNALTKFIPDYIFHASKLEVVNFIAGLYMGDGSIPNFKNNSKIHIEYSSISKTLIYQLQELLLQLNILSYIKKRKPGTLGNHFCYYLIISHTQSLLNFYQEIPLISYKKENLNNKIALLHSRNKNKKSKFEYLPIGIKKSIIKYSKHKIIDSSYYGKKLNKIKTTFDSVINLRIPETQRWLNKNIGWDYITTIEDLGLHNTIGFTVEKTNIIGGSIITHNTGGVTFGTDFKKVAISSAWEPGDPIEQLYNTAQKNPNSLAFKLTTFQINLDIKKENKSIESEYINDFIKARREFEGIRFTKFNTFIEIENLRKACRAVSILDAIPNQIETTTSAGTQYYAGLTIQRITPNQVSDSLSFIHVDPALKKDSAALAIARPIQEDGKWKIQIDALLKWEPHTDNQGNKRIVSFIDIEDKLFEIAKIRKVGKITFDQWQCLQEDEKIYHLVKNNWVLTKVKNLQKGEIVLSKEGKYNTIINLEQKKEVPCIKITTKNGYELIGTFNHPILNKDNKFVELQDLNINDKIKLYIPKIETVDKTPITKLEHQAVVLGYLIAEGNWSLELSKSKYDISFTNTENQVIQDYINSYKLTTGNTPKLYTYSTKNLKHKNKSTVKKGDKQFYNFITKDLQLKTGSYNKEIPNYIFNSSKKEIGLFLSAMYEGDGNIICFIPTEKYKRQSPRIYVEYNTVSKKLATDIQNILLYLGIKSTKSKYTKLTPAKNKTYIYRISIYGQNIIKFKQAINFRSSRKQEALNKAINHLSFKRQSRVNHPEDKIIKIEKINSNIIHMEVSGDNTYCSSFINHNSQSIIQKLNSQGIDAQQVSCSREMQFTYYTLFRDLLAHDYIVLPRDNIWTNNAVTELSELVLKANKQIIHPTAGKDLADAIVNAIYQCNQYMIKSGLNLTTGLHSSLIQSKGLAPLQKITVSKFNTSNLKIGGAIDKLYKNKF